MLLGKRTNVLLVKDDVGKAKPTTRKIPSDQFAFGKANVFNESAAEVIDKFQYRDETEKGRFKHPQVNDFTRLNKAVLKEGATNAAANRALRTRHDIKIVQKTQRSVASRGTTNLPIENMAFGKANRPQTPVGGIIMNNYGEEGEIALQQKYQQFMHSKPAMKGPINIRMTNA